MAAVEVAVENVVVTVTLEEIEIEYLSRLISSFPFYSIPPLSWIPLWLPLPLLLSLRFLGFRFGASLGRGEGRLAKYRLAKARSSG